LKDLLGSDPNRRLAGLRNAVVFGRAVTNALEKLRSRVDDFDDWYKHQTAVLSEDESFRRLYKMRSEILKEGVTNVGNSLNIKSFSTNDMHRFGPAPPGATSFFIGDHRNGSGWMVPQADGTEKKVYVDLPGDIGTTLFTMDIGERRNVPVSGVLARYLRTLGEIIGAAETQFVPPG
jgi:hypothetical protein